MRLILALSIALGTANLTYVPADAGLDLMTHATASTSAQLAFGAHARLTLRQAKTTAAFDRAPAVLNVAARDVGATPSALPTGFTRVIDDSADIAAEAVETSDAMSAIAVH